MNDIITKEILEGIGVRLAPDEESEFLNQVNAELKSRIGLAVADELDEAQLAKMKEMSESVAPEALQEWLTQSVPALNEIIEDEVDILLGEIAKSAGSAAQS